jgi:hypothetical protein
MRCLHRCTENTVVHRQPELWVVAWTVHSIVRVNMTRRGMKALPVSFIFRGASLILSELFVYLAHWQHSWTYFGKWKISKRIWICFSNTKTKMTKVKKNNTTWKEVEMGTYCSMRTMRNVRVSSGECDLWSLLFILSCKDLKQPGGTTDVVNHSLRPSYRAPLE